MNTIPSHLVINAAIEKKFGKKLNIAKSAFLFGAVLPDIPLGLLMLGSYAYYGFILGQDTTNLMDAFIHPAYYENPWWIAAHNFLHAPLLLLAAIAALWGFRQKTGTVGHWGLWFAAGCLAHTLLDIPTHAGDGPLLLFPFNWQARFNSPVSYWDLNYYGIQFMVFEALLNVSLLAYLFLPKILFKHANKNT
jgi:membrane-bound metal-dependent hydrolase YbcI (DUF457 family)